MKFFRFKVDPGDLGAFFWGMLALYIQHSIHSRLTCPELVHDRTFECSSVAITLSANDRRCSKN